MLWFCESGKLQLVCDASPFETVVAFGADGSPYADETTVLYLGKGTQTGLKILKDIDANVVVEDPHIIIDNEG